MGKVIFLILFNKNLLINSQKKINFKYQKKIIQFYNKVIL